MSNTTLNSLDLCLPKEKTAVLIADWKKTHNPTTVQSRISNYVIGSCTDEDIYYTEDLGLFQAVNEAWKNHWNLRTSPEDWWLPVAMRIAKGIGGAAQRGNRTVREMFVEYEGKKTLCVDLAVRTIQEVDYESFFRQMTGDIQEKIKFAEFAQLMQNDFGTSEQTHQVASQINLMASMQLEFFNFEMGLCGCGIKGIEMLGTQNDWTKLLWKFQKLRAILAPIQTDLQLGRNWFAAVERVYTNLVKTFAASGTKSPSMATTEIAGFWADIFMIGDGWKYGSSSMGYPAKEYNGWFIEFITGYRNMLVDDFKDPFSTEKAKFRGLNNVPMMITIKWKEPQAQEEAKLVAGIMGYKVHQDNTPFGVPSIQPNHMWALCLPKGSPLRGGSTA